MRRSGWVGFVAAIIVVSAASIVEAKTWPGGFSEEANFRPPQHALVDCCPRPSWWEQTIAPQINTSEDFQEVWLSKELTNTQKAKAMFRAIEEHMGRDDEIASKAINYYQYVDKKYPHILALKELGVAQYFNLDRDLEHYSGKVGDTTAGLVNDLARLYLKEGRARESAGLISRLVIERGHEINGHLLETSSLIMIDALKKQGRIGEAVGVVNYAIKAYDGDWEMSLIKAREELKTTLGWRYYLAVGWLKYATAFLFAFVTMMATFYIIQYRQPAQTA